MIERRLISTYLPSFLAAACLTLTGCGFEYLFGPPPTDTTPETDIELGVAIVRPTTSVTSLTGTTANIQWADIANTEGGAVVRVQAQREATSGGTPLPGAFTGPVIHLIGDGSPGSGRDAAGDGDNDLFEWDLNGVRVGTYLITVTIEAPDGTTDVALSHDPDRNVIGVINVTSNLPTPTLTFTAPGATDETVTTGNTFDIEWNDNGNANASALLRLGLDPDDDHNNGNEITLTSNEPLSDDGNTGMFTFFFQDENGDTVPDGSYTVFAVIDDGEHDPVTVEATGQLVLNP